MRITSGIGIAWRSMSRNRLRTFFMMAGVMIGICSLTILDSVGENTKRETMKRFKNMIGTFDTVIIRPGRGEDTRDGIADECSANVEIRRCCGHCG